MSKIKEAKLILEAMGLPKRQHNDRSALILLALCTLKENDRWSKAKAMNMSVACGCIPPAVPFGDGAVMGGGPAVKNGLISLPVF